MKSRPGIFASLVLAVVISTSAIGFFIFDQSQKNQASVSEKSLQYEASKQPTNQELAKAEDGSQLEQAPAPTNDEQQSSAISQDITVYFSKNPDSSDDLTKVFPVVRQTKEANTVKGAVEQLIAGPTSQEKSEGYFGGVSLKGDSNCDGQDFKLEFNEGSLRLQFCKEFGAYEGEQALRQQTQMLTTLKELTNLDSIIILDNNGNCLFGQSFVASCKQ